MSHTRNNEEHLQNIPTTIAELYQRIILADIDDDAISKKLTEKARQGERINSKKSIDQAKNEIEEEKIKDVFENDKVRLGQFIHFKNDPSLPIVVLQGVTYDAYLKFFKDKFPLTPPALIEYLLKGANQAGYLAASEKTIQNQLIQENIWITIDENKKHYQFIENKDGSVTYIERFYINSYRNIDYSDEKEVEKEIRPTPPKKHLAVCVTTSTFSLDSNNKIQHIYNNHTNILLDKKAEAIFSGTNHSYIKSYDRKVESIENQLELEIKKRVEAPIKTQIIASEVRATIRKITDTITNDYLSTYTGTPKETYVQNALNDVIAEMDNNGKNMEKILEKFKIFLICCSQNERKNSNLFHFNSKITTTGTYLEKKLKESSSTALRELLLNDKDHTKYTLVPDVFQNIMEEIYTQETRKLKSNPTINPKDTIIGQAATLIAEAKSPASSYDEKSYKKLTINQWCRNDILDDFAKASKPIKQNAPKV